MASRRLALSHLSALDVAPAELVSIAAEAGYWAVGLRLNPAAPGAISYPLPVGTADLAEVSARMKDTGVAVYDVEFIPLTPDVDVRSFAPMFETAAALGARRVNVSGDDTDFDRLASRFGQTCELAASFGLGVDLEFMRWREVGSLAQAADVVRRSGSSTGGILLDALHLSRSGGKPSDVRAVDPRMVRSAQLCDAPARQPAPDRIIEEARNYRLPPGDGELPLRELVAALPVDTALSLEVPMPPGAGHSPREHVRRIREAAARLLASA